MGEPSGPLPVYAGHRATLFRNKLSGPLLDRIEPHLTVAREATALEPWATTETDDHRERTWALVADARERQQRRQGGADAFLDPPGLRQFPHAGPEVDEGWLENGGRARRTLSLRVGSSRCSRWRVRWRTWNNKIKKKKKIFFFFRNIGSPPYMQKRAP